ncbi:MAG: hypothetical protein KGD64_06820 [Candidatus Heimdallarchaeota archaeon]|nr:hypothetical protein [Candidatus Heimdallarchaeota archaeon]
MKKDLEYIVPLKERDTINFFFKIIKPSKKIWLITVLIFLSWYVAWYFSIRFFSTASSSSQYRLIIILIVVISISSPLLGLFLWKWVGGWVTKKAVYETLKTKHEKKDEIRESLGRLKQEREYHKFSFFRVIIALLIGFDISPETKYYLEEKTYSIDIGSFRSFIRTRLYDMISASLGIGFLIASIVKYAISDTFTGFVTGALVLLAAPILICWLTPVVWTIKDAQIKYIKPNNLDYELSDKVRRSVISRFFGLSAWFAGISFFIDLISELQVFNNSSFASTVAMFFLAILGVIIVTILAFGTLYLFGMLYLNFFHEKRVNDLRGKLSEIIPYAQTNAIVSEESEYLI